MSARRTSEKDPPLAPEIAILIGLLDEAYEKKAWHGPNLKGSIRGLDAGQAAWRPQPQRHCIAEHVIHAAYWKYAVRRRILGEARGSFPLKGSNWFPVVAPLAPSEWRDHIALLEAAHRALRQTIHSVSPEQLSVIPPGARVTNLATITGIAAHDVYHAGQIQLLKRLQGS
jgi:hypothetical protein